MLRSAAVADALDDLGLRHQTLGADIRPLGPARVVGRAIALAVVPVTSASMPRATGLLSAVEAVVPDSVLVLGADPGVRAACWGELVTRAAQMRGAVGLVTSGYVRDAAQLAELGFPVFAAGRCPARPDGRVDIVATAKTTWIDGVEVATGDLIVADEDGVVVVPEAAEREVHERVVRLAAVEDGVRAALASGTPLRALVDGVDSMTTDA